ncbi:MAG: type II toxin-antitoxin system PemK/MazF family toxin [Mycobacteriales bacterium]
MRVIAPWQIWWAKLDPIVGHEQAGTRPVLVISSQFHLRLTRAAMLTIVPLTTRERPYLLHRIRIDIPDNRPTYVITEQQRSISADRITGKTPMYELTSEQIHQVRSVLRAMMDI